ncbi:MAG TPA: MFS transporter [Steroidobacteraceae bacterium]|jgi:predicted MFS family arabinose efflux permease|nr:MFS transporter [Steroidobacteraceae bacterium]
MKAAGAAALDSQDDTEIRRWYVLFLLTAVYAMNIADRFVISTLIEPIKADLHISDSAVGFLTGVSLALFYVAAGLPLSVLADRVNRRNLVALSIGAWSLMTVVCGFTRTFWQLMAARVLVGVGEAGGTPPSQSLISDYFPWQRRALALSIYAVGASIGSMLGSCTGYLSDRWGWRSAFFVLGIPGIILACVLRATVKEPVRGRLDDRVASSHGQGFKNMLEFAWRESALRHALIGGALYSTWAFGSLWWMPSFLVRSHHMSLGDAGGAVSLMHGMGGTVVLLGTTLLMRKLTARDARAVPWFLMLCCVLGAIPLILALTATTRAATLSMLWLFVPLSYAPIGPCFALVQNLVPAPMRAKVVGLFLLMTTVGNLVIAPQLVGIESDLLTARYGADSLRTALLPLSLVGFWASLHFWMCSLRLKAGLIRAGNSSGLETTSRGDVAQCDTGTIKL